MKDEKVKTASSYWREKKVLVTGVSGFIGSWLAQGLVNNGAYVVGLDCDFNPSSFLHVSGTDSQIIKVQGRLEDFNLLRRILSEYEIDTCFHLGAQAIVQTAVKSPLPTFESNIKGTWNVLEAARNSELIERIVVASSDKAYGTHEKLPYSEEHCLRGLHPYDVSKTCSDLLSQTYYHTYGLPIGIARSGNTYGGGDLNFNRIVPGTILSLLRNKRPIIRSDGTPIRDYLYIKDAINGFLLIARNLDREEVQGQAFNFGTGNPISVLDLVNKIRFLMDKMSLEPVILNDVSHEIQKQYLSFKKAMRLLRWKLRYSLNEGLRATIQWYREFFASTRNSCLP